MINFENTNVYGFEGAIYGMRAAHESWDKSDSSWHVDIEEDDENKTFNMSYILGDNDLKLATTLAKAGSDHGKFLRCIHVQTYITAPIRWWVEMDTYKVGTTRLSTSLMHKVLNRPGKAFTREDFSTDHIHSAAAWKHFDDTVSTLNQMADNYKGEYEYETEQKIPHEQSKKTWYEIQELVPRCYNYGSLLDLNYAVLRNIAHSDRKNHKQDEWREGFFEWMATLPYAEELIFS